MNFQEIRQKYPDYNDMSDDDFAQKFHQKFYSDMDFGTFASKVGYAKGQSAPVAKEPSFLDKAIGVGEAGLSTLTGLTTGMAAGAVGGLQGVLDTAMNGTFGTQEGVAQSGEKFHEQSTMATYEPRTEVGKEYAGKVGQFIAEQAPALVAVAPQLEALGGLAKFAKQNKDAAALPKAPSADAAKLQEMRAKVAEPVKEMPTKQAELDLGQPNQYGHRPSEFTIDENGIPIRRNASLEAQETVRQGDLFSYENQATELRNDVLNNAKAGEEGVPGSRDYLRKQEEELAYQQKAAQDTLIKEEPVVEPSQRSVEVEKPWGQTRVGGSQRGSIDFSFGKERERQLIREEEAQTKQIIKDLEASRNVEHSKAALDSLGWMKTVRPLYDKVQKLQETLAHERIPYELVMKMEDAYREANSLWKDVQTFTYGDPTAKHPLGHRLSEDQGRSIAGSNLSHTVRNTPQIEQAFKEYIQGIEEYKKTLNPRSKYDRQTLKEINAVLGNVSVLGQSKFGKGQKGSIGFFGKDPYEKFAENLRKEVPNVTEAELTKLWEEKQKQSGNAITNQKMATTQSKIAKDLAGLDPKYTGEVWTPEKAVEVLSTVPDITNRGLLKEQFGSSGRLQRDLLNHPAVTWVYNLTNKAVENGRIQARKILDDTGTGIIPMIRKQVMFHKGGEAEMRSYFQWRFKNEGSGEVLPETFSPAVKKIHEALNRGDEQLLAKMNEVLAKDGKKPITNIDNHMVHYWSGPYRAYVYVKTEGGGSRLGFFVSEKTIGDAKKALTWIQENIPNVDTTKASEIKFVKSDARGRSSMFDHLLELTNNTDPAVAEALQAFKERVQGLQERHLGEQNRQKFRAGVQGFQGNKPWMTEARNYADSIDTVRTKFDAGYQWIAAQEIRQQMEPVLKAQQDGKIHVGGALSLGQKFVDHALGKNIDTSAITKFMDYLEDISPKNIGAVRRGTTTTQHFFSRVTLPYLLALKGTQAVQSVLQVGQATIPRMIEMRKQYGGDYVHVATSLAQGSMDGMFQLANTVTQGKFEKLSRDLMQKVDGDFSPTTQAIHQAIRDLDVARMSLSDTGVSKEGGFWKSWGNAAAEGFLDAPMNLFEGPTRTWAFSSFVRQAVKDGYKIEDAIKLGREQMDTMVNYNPEAGAMGLANMGLVGQEARGLHTFMINYYTQLARYGKLAAESGGKQAGPLLTYLAITFSLGGAVGFIGADLADWLLDGLKIGARGTKADSPELQKFSLRQWLMENTPEAVSVGPLSASTDLGLYGSFTTKVIDPDRTFIDNMFPKTMASLQLTKAAVKAPLLLNSELSQKDRGTIIEGVSPKFLTQSIRNRFHNKDNIVYDPSAERAGLPMYQRTDKEQQISKHGFGVRGLAETMAQADTGNYFKTQKNLGASQKEQLIKLEKILVASIKSGKRGEELLNDSPVAQQIKSLIVDWHIDEDQVQKRIESTAESYGLPAEALRKLVRVKGAKLSDVDNIKDLSGIINRARERQEKYGR